MDCPKCRASMETLVVEGIAVDRCTDCKGIWFDMLEMDDLKKIEGSESIDIGDELTGKRFSRLRKIDCPVCNTLMVPMVDKDQFEIEYELCPTCFGTFFDAGEFRELKHETIIKRFKQMLQILRSNL